MKQLLVTLIACAGALLSTTQVQAAPASKKFGGFSPGKTFSFVVEDRILVKTVGTKIAKLKTPPSGIPNYKVGQKIRFTIGAKGQLTAKGFSMPFKADGGSANVYLVPPSKNTTTQANTASVFKNAKGKPTNVALSFFKAEIKGYIPTVYSVYYTLN